MEFLSAAFVILLERVFQSPNPLLGTSLHRPYTAKNRDVFKGDNPPGRPKR